MNTCCDNLKWEFIQDAHHARGCEFTYGKCVSCGSPLIHLYHVATNDAGYYEAVSEKFISEMLKYQGAELKQFMKQWYDELYD
jgi:hypothetical protein